MPFFTFFFWGGGDEKTKGTLILTSLLEDVVRVSLGLALVVVGPPKAPLLKCRIRPSHCVYGLEWR